MKIFFPRSKGDGAVFVSPIIIAREKNTFARSVSFDFNRARRALTKGD